MKMKNLQKKARVTGLKYGGNCKENTDSIIYTESNSEIMEI
jgi:hypothetical protein